MAGRPVENLVELNTDFEISFRKDRAVGFEKTVRLPLKA